MESKSSLSAAMNNVLFEDISFFTGVFMRRFKFYPAILWIWPFHISGSPLKLCRSRRKGKNEKQ
jgi:hypothetical protein